MKIFTRRKNLPPPFTTRDKEEGGGLFRLAKGPALEEGDNFSTVKTVQRTGTLHAIRR